MRERVVIKNKKAFTLAEVLITLVIIGIVAAITVPIAMNNAKWKQYKSGYLKAQSSLNHAVLKFREQEGYPPNCHYGGITAGYYDKNELSSQEDCQKLYESFLKNMNVVKVCQNNARSNGCIPAYEGKDTYYKSRYPDKSVDEIAALVGACSVFTQNPIYTGRAFVTGDGMIFFNANTTSVIHVDVNGFQGPNKWGHDVHSMSSVVKNKGDIPTYGTYKIGCAFYEKGGKNPIELVYGKK